MIDAASTMTTVDSAVWIPRLIASLQLASICHSRAKLTSTFVWIEVETCVNIRIWWIRRANLGEIRQDGCTPVEGLLDQLVRAFVVQVISSFFGSLPFAALVIFFYKLKAAPLWLRRAIFWSFLCCYVLLCFMVVCIFIALVSPVDANKWFYTSAIDLIMTWKLGTSVPQEGVRR